MTEPALTDRLREAADYVGDLRRESGNIYPALTMREAATELERLTTQIAGLVKPPASCPITGRDFFMVIDGKPTYGGPRDSDTIPMRGNNGYLRVERYDHDAGAWQPGGHCLGLLVTDPDQGDPDEHPHGLTQLQRSEEEEYFAERAAQRPGGSEGTVAASSDAVNDDTCVGNRRPSPSLPVSEAENLVALLRNEANASEELDPTDSSVEVMRRAAALVELLPDGTRENGTLVIEGAQYGLAEMPKLVLRLLTADKESARWVERFAYIAERLPSGWGHCTTEVELCEQIKFTDDRAEKAEQRLARFDGILSKDQAYGHLSHAEIAGMVRMLMRGDTNHEGVCVAARDRIIYLANALGDAQDALLLSNQVLVGLQCAGCKAQGAELASKCCKDADCDAGWYGINADEVAAAVTANVKALDAIKVQPPAWLVWSNEHSAWWRPEAAGYTCDILLAGLFTRADATAHCTTRSWRPGDRPPELMVPAPAWLKTIHQTPSVPARPS